MKYIMFESDLGAELKQYIPVIFPNNIVHSIVSDFMLAALAEHQFECKVRSAGFVRFDATTRGILVTCSGESETMGVKSHPEDGDIIEMNDYAHGLCDAGAGDLADAIAIYDEL